MTERIFKKLQYFNGEFYTLVIGDFCSRIIPPWDLHVPFTCIIGSPVILFIAILLHNICFILHLSLHINDVKKRIHVLAKPQRSSLRIHWCVSERSERAIFWVVDSFTVKKGNFFTINVKFKVILSSKSGGGGGIFVQAIPPTQKKWGDTSPRDLRHYREGLLKRGVLYFVKTLKYWWPWGHGGQ